MIELLLAAGEAAEVAEHEPSKTLFYLAGGAFAAWAIGISVFGFTRPSFPTTAAQSRAVMAISALLMVLVLAATLVTN